MANIPLWFQIFYSIWQFVRTAKLFKLAYGVPYHLYLYLRGKVCFPPFQRVNCCLVLAGKKFNFDVRGTELSWIRTSQGVVTVPNLPKGVIGVFDRFDYIIPESKRNLLGDLFFHKPDVLTLSADYITEDFCIVNYDDQKTLLEKTLSPDIYIFRDIRRVLLYPSEDRTLNQNLIRILSVGPLLFTSKGFPVVSTWFSVTLAVADLLFNTFLQSMFKVLQTGLVFAFRGILKRVNNRRTRYSLSLFLSSVSESMKICDTLAGNFYDLDEGCLALLNNFADPSYCEVVDTELPAIIGKPSDGHVTEAFTRFTNFGYPRSLSHYVKVETRCGTVYMSYNDHTVCVFPVNYSQNHHYIELKNHNEDVKTMLSIMGFINQYKSNILDIGSDGYAHSVSLQYLVNNVAEFRACKVIKIRKKITVAG